ncbi:MAG: hypothetical protein WBX19_05640 [Terracidiphilus sp.]
MHKPTLTPTLGTRADEAVVNLRPDYGAMAEGLPDVLQTGFLPDLPKAI